jgi:Mg-chelatase subunit ChlD/type II secretory pathway pseudopilin PulG
MNPESPTPREQLEVRLTALLLGELSLDESAALQKIISKDAQLAALHARLKQTIELVHETAADPAELTAEPPAPRRLGEERRQKLLAGFKTVTPAQFAPKPKREQRQRRVTLLEIAAVVAILGLLAGSLLPTLSASKSRSSSAGVLSNLRQIEVAKQLWAQDNNKVSQDMPTLQELAPYLGRGSDGNLPGTPLGERYIIGKVDESPRAEVDAIKAQKFAGRQIVMLPSKDAGKKEIALADTIPQLAESREFFRVPKEELNAPQPLGGVPAPASPPAQETIVLPSNVETAGMGGTGNPGDIKLVDNYNLNPVALSNAAKKEPLLENKDAHAVQDLALLSFETQDKLSRASDLRLGESIEKEKADGTKVPVALGVDTGVVSFDENNMQGLRAPIAGKNVVTGVAGHGAVQAGTELAGLNQGANGQTAATTPSTVAAGNSTRLYFANSAPMPAGGAVGSGGFGGGGGGAAGKPVVPQTPALVTATPAPASEISSFDNSGTLAFRSTNYLNGRYSYVAGSSLSDTEQNVLQNRALTVQQNATADPNWIGVLKPATAAAGTSNTRTAPPDIDAETPSVIMMSLGRIANSASNQVAQLDTSAAKTQVGFKFDSGSNNTIATEDRPLAKPATPPSEPQPEVQVSENALSTFSLNVSDVSFKLAAASLERGVMPDAGSVRSEEFINAFDYRDPEPAPGAAIGFAWERAHYPFAHNRDLLRFSVKTAAAGRQPGRPLNLVLLLDNSGSMERADRVAIIHEALRVLAAQLQSQDTISVVTFARTARLWVDGIPGTQAAQVLGTVSSLTPEGGTDLGDALDLAYATAKRHYLMNGVNRVVLLTDGAANLGNVDPDALKKNVEAQRKQGIDLDCFGIGWEGYNDDLLEVLTRNGDGRYGFINTPEEAASGFAAQLAGALRVAASDVKVQVEFNPARVTSYRQIGYAKHQLTKEQFRDNTVVAAQIGAAESGNALYTVEVNPQGSGPICTVHVRYRDPGTANYFEHAWDVPSTGNAVALEQSSPAMRLAATASAFSEWLVSSPFAADVSPDALLGYLRGVPEVYGADTRPAQLETMIREAKSLTGK